MSIDTAPPTVWGVARRPKWIGALVFALAVAAGFAALGQWQLERGIASATVIERDTETVKPLTEITSPQAPTNTAADGQRVTVDGTFGTSSWIVLTGRSDGAESDSDRPSDGAWVVGRFVTDADGTPASVAVAVGWAPSTGEARSTARELGDAAPSSLPVSIVGRYVPGEPPQLDDFENGELSSLSPPALVNLWQGEPTEVYGGYIVTDEVLAGLDPIAAPPPSGDVQLNWLNIFYAVEWVVFAGFAVYMWFRLVKDAWERETDPGDGTDDEADDDTTPPDAGIARPGRSFTPVN